MAVKKAAGGTKGQDAPAPKKAGGTKGAAKTETSPKRSSASEAPAKAAPKKAAAKAATPKSATPKAAPKKAGTAPVKLSTSQAELLKKVHGSGEPGYRAEKKAEQRTLDALQERKLIKRGAKHKESGSYHYQISNAGKKHVESQAAADTAAGGAGAGTGSTTSSS